MAEALLVNIDIPVGLEVINALDAAGLTVNVALWAWLSEYEDWRLLIASRKLDKEDPLRRYLLVNAATDAAGIAIQRAPTIMILKTTDSLVRELRALGRRFDLEGTRQSGKIGDRYVRDSYVYRVK
ncbi:MAG: hypothetical protein ABSG41_12495 [Bryobacteraceae bacterium]|jgi:hypothetical protein